VQGQYNIKTAAQSRVFYGCLKVNVQDHLR